MIYSYELEKLAQGTFLTNIKLEIKLKLLKMLKTLFK